MDWVHLGETLDGFTINRYFLDHPEMVLGIPAAERTQYGHQDYTVVTSVNTASEALTVSIGEKAKVDMPYMAQLSGKTEDELERDLAGVIFRDVQCEGNPARINWASVELSSFPFVTADEYLSGNVRRKLQTARAMYESLSDGQWVQMASPAPQFPALFHGAYVLLASTAP